MYEIKNFIFKGENVFILNKGNKIVSTYKGRETHVIIYEKNLDKSEYKFNQEIKFNSSWGVIYLTLLLNEMIIISSRKSLYIFKKDNKSKYYELQEFINSNWAEITNIKELINVKDHFAICGYFGLIIFKKQNDKYEIIFELDQSILRTNRIADFMEIKGKEKSFILCGVRNIFITNNRNILNKINFHENDMKSWLGRDYICEFSDELFLISGQRYITLVNTTENKFEQINFFNGKRTPVLGSSEIYKYDINTIILLSFNEILFIQILYNKKIQINMIFSFQSVNSGLLKFIKEEKSVYFIDEKNNNKLNIITFNDKIKYR